MRLIHSKAIRRLLRLVIGLPLVASLPLFSAVFLTILSPLLIASLFMRNREPRGTYSSIKESLPDRDVPFNRTNDISKLYGCNTRNVPYRWDIFNHVLERMRPVEGRPALDFGAGSLRDTWELARAGFNVLAIDQDETQLRRSEQLYNWAGVGHRPELTSQSLDALTPNRRFDLITAFDVLEHLVQLEYILPQLCDRLNPEGYMFVTVPNGRSFRELVLRIQYRLLKLLGEIERRPGVYHVNFLTPEAWGAFFVDHGFSIHSHEMVIGSFANDWNFLHEFPLGISGLAQFPCFRPLHRLFSARWLMRRLDLLDQNLSRVTTKRLWAWNLFVLTRSKAAAAETTKDFFETGSLPRLHHEHDPLGTTPEACWCFGNSEPNIHQLYATIPTSCRKAKAALEEKYHRLTHDERNFANESMGSLCAQILMKSC